MELIRNIKEMQSRSDQLRKQGKTISFVPTMGALHEGHLSLCRIAKQQSDSLVLSIFVNPAQFAANEDLNSYPKDYNADEKMAKNEGVDILFYPDADEMYPSNYKTWVQIHDLDQILCGKSRPDHFRGVSTVMAKLLNIVKANTLIMGQKDAQQAAIIQQMMIDLNIDTKLILAPTTREKDGLAMSSRNTYLTKESRKSAPALFNSLNRIANGIKINRTRFHQILNDEKMILQDKENIKVDYLEALTYPKLQPITKKNEKILIAGAVYLANVRLIDNIIIEQE